MSCAEIIHGSISNKAGKVETERWVVNPWFVATQPDNETLDVPECGTWTTFGRPYRDLDAMVSIPTGQTNSYGRPLGRFPASVPLKHVSYLSNAVVGQTRWDDPMVEYGASIVLGGDDETAWKFVKECCRRMTRLYKHNMTVIREVEKDSFRKNSYLCLLENGLYKEPQFEGDYNDPAPYSDTEDASNVDETSETSECGEEEVEGENRDFEDEANAGE